MIIIIKWKSAKSKTQKSRKSKTRIWKTREKTSEIFELSEFWTWPTKILIIIQSILNSLRIYHLHSHDKLRYLLESFHCCVKGTLLIKLISAGWTKCNTKDFWISYLEGWSLSLLTYEIILTSATSFYLQIVEDNIH